MDVILLERIEKLGQMGDVVTVKNGFARNFLLPRRKALRATKQNIAGFENQRAQYEAQNIERRNDADSIVPKLDGLHLVVIRQASEGGQLYGSVAARDIAGSVTDAGFTIDRRQVQMSGPIKTLGIHEIRIVLHPEVSARVRINVARSEEEAKAQSAGRGAEQSAADGAQPGEGDLEEFFEDEELAAKAAAEATAETESSEDPQEPISDVSEGAGESEAAEDGAEGPDPSHKEQ